MRLSALLRAGGSHIADPEFVARTGWTCDDLAAALDAAAPRGPYALVSLLVGVNDQYRGDTAAAYAPRFARLLVRAVGLAGGEPRRVLVVSIPDWGVTPFADGRDRAAIVAGIDAFNAVNRAAALAAGAAYLDVTAHSRQAGPGPAALVADGLHPSAPTYERWAQLALPLAAAVVGG